MPASPAAAAFRLKNQLVERNRERAHAYPRGMPDGIGDRTHRTGDADLAYTLDAKCIDIGVVLLDEDCLDAGDIRVYWYVIVGEIGVHDPSGTGVHDCLFMKRK